MSSPADAQGDPAARAPRRARGQQRVDALVGAAADVFARKGYEAATMTEIAAQAGSSIGSLYQFFRTKEAVAGALLRVQVDALRERFAGLAGRAGGLDAAALAAELAGLLVAFRAAHPSFAVLVEAPGATLDAVRGVRQGVRTCIVDVLQRHRPAADPALLRAMAPAIQQAMKAGVQLQAEFDGAERDAARVELVAMLSAYLAARLPG